MLSVRTCKGGCFASRRRDEAIQLLVSLDCGPFFEVGSHGSFRCGSPGDFERAVNEC